jgi:uncharacterized membrane protein YidH (DUF202 family)
VATTNEQPSRATAILATAVALALINIGVASLIVAAIDRSGLASVGVGLIVLGVGLAAAVGAVWLWRRYLSSVRHSD